MLGLAVGIDALQREAGPDDRVTGMAGIAGVPTGSSFRQWCGVWSPNATIPNAWLTSGAGVGNTPSLSGDRVTIVNTHTVGTVTDRTDQELVEVGLVDVPELDGSPRGRFGYWVGDEGVKVSAVVLDSELQYGATSGVRLRPDRRRLTAPSYNPSASTEAKILTFEQTKQVASGVSLTGSFHSMTHSSRALASTAPDGVTRPGYYVVGAFNVNTTSEAAWRAILEYPDSTNPVFGLSSARSLSGGRRIRDLFAQRGRPFSSIHEFVESGLIKEAFDSSSPRITTPTQTEFLTDIGRVLTVRSDTFKVRAYGDALNPVTRSKEAMAFCEAVVQRTPEVIDSPSGPLGRKFVVAYFRWLGPDDI